MSAKKTIATITQEIFSLVGFALDKLEISETKEAGFTINITVDPEESGILIGYHGETIASIQLIIALIAQKQLEEWHRITVNINEYRDKREQSLKEMAANSAERVLNTGEELVMPPMGSFDRRIIHMALSENPDVITESVGEGKERRLIIYPKTKAGPNSNAKNDLNKT